MVLSDPGMDRLALLWNRWGSGRITHLASARTLAPLKPKRSRFGCNTKAPKILFSSFLSFCLSLTFRNSLNSLSLNEEHLLVFFICPETDHRASVHRCPPDHLPRWSGPFRAQNQPKLSNNDVFDPLNSNPRSI